MHAPLSVRARRAGDLPRLDELVRRTYAESGYPKNARNARAEWLVREDELGGWVCVVTAEEGPERVVGHVALHPQAPDDDPESHAAVWSRAAGVPVDRLAVVSRLLSAWPGAGTVLLQHAVEEAERLGRRAVLQVEATAPAYGFYLSRGWTDLGIVDGRWGEVDVRISRMVWRPKG